METFKFKPSVSEFNNKLEEIKKVVSEYKWGDKTIMPYGFAIKIDDFLSNLDSYDNMTYISQCIAIDELNGFIEHVVNPWTEYELSRKVTVKTKSGQIFEMPAEIANELIQEGAIELVSAENKKERQTI